MSPFLSFRKQLIWPTLYAAPLAAAAVASQAWKLSVPQTAGALATALALSSGVAAPAVGAMSSRWMALAAAHSGVLAAQGARQELAGDRGLMERYGGRIVGVRISTKRLIDGLGERFLFDEIDLEPYAIARQALAAVEICRSLAPDLDVERISEIVVKVPQAQFPIIDRPGIPEHRMACIASAQYQIATALLAPARLPDVRRQIPLIDERMRSLAAKVRVRPSPRLERHYPGAWPAQVTIRIGRRRLTRSLLHPSGDWRNPLTWDGLAAKLNANGVAGALIERIRNAQPQAAFPAGILMEFIEPRRRVR